MGLVRRRGEMVLALFLAFVLTAATNTAAVVAGDAPTDLFEEELRSFASGRPEVSKVLDFALSASGDSEAVLRMLRAAAQGVGITRVRWWR